MEDNGKVDKRIVQALRTSLAQSHAKGEFLELSIDELLKPFIENANKPRISPIQLGDIQAGIIKSKKNIENEKNDLEKTLTFVKTNTGNPAACLASLGGLAESSAAVSWLEQHDLESFKQLAYVSGVMVKLRINQWGLGLYELLMPLLSDSEVLVNWFIAEGDTFYDKKTRDKPSNLDFLKHNHILALQGDWANLFQRCESFLSNIPASQRKFEADHRFLLALSSADVEGMRAALEVLITSKSAKSRNNDMNGYLSFFLNLPATLLAKIAWRHGYPITVESAYVPIEMLPIIPNDQYLNVYDFMSTKITK